MTTISSHALQPPSERAIKASRSWSVRSLELAEQALNDNKSDPATAICARAKNIGLYNLGMLAEVRVAPGQPGQPSSSSRWRATLAQP